LLTLENAASSGYGIPAEIYDIGVGWDPHPEINHLLFLARQAGIGPRSALELGCGTGRLLGALRKVVPDVCGIELSPAMAKWACKRTGNRIVVGDMANFAFGRRFDLIYTSANTIRHVLSDEALQHG